MTRPVYSKQIGSLFVKLSQVRPGHTDFELDNYEQNR